MGDGLGRTAEIEEAHVSSFECTRVNARVTGAASEGEHVERLGMPELRPLETFGVDKTPVSLFGDEPAFDPRIHHGHCKQNGPPQRHEGQEQAYTQEEPFHPIIRIGNK